jgi:hypothetical protein
MHAKILRPENNGKVVYNNKGSARRTANYLQKEAKEGGQDAAFFGSAGKVYTADEVVAMLDQNHKGLGKEDEKFHSLVFSPNQEEAGRLGNDPQALQRYTQDAMDLYAKNFKLKGRKEISESDLVWAAVIHQERKNRGTDEGIQGEQKAGLQTHIHVIVSARDAAQKITLNPNTTATRFNRVQFQAQANVLMEEHLGQTGAREIGASAPSRSQRVAEKTADIKERAASNKDKKPLTPAQIEAKEARLDVQVARVNSKLSEKNQLDTEQVKRVAKERGYNNVFYATLGKIERNAEKGTFTPEPYEYLRTGRVQKDIQLREMPSQQLVYTSPSPRTPKQQTIPVAFQSLERTMNQLSRALAAKSRTQDVRSEAEQARDYEHER